MPFQDLSIFRRSCILDSVHCRCSLPPPLGPPPGTPFGLSAGWADLAGAPPGQSRAERRWHRAGHGDARWAVVPRGAGEGQRAHAVPCMNCCECHFTVLKEPAGHGGFCTMRPSRGASAWARWYPVLGGARRRPVRQDDTRGHEICWNSFVGDGKGGCKAALDPSCPVHHSPARFVGIRSVKPHELSR